MTYSPERPTLSFEGIEEVAAALREAGHRFSAARRVVLEALFAADGPVSAEYIADGLDGRLTRSDLSSVYRNLELLEELGVVRHVHIGHGPSLYAISGRAPSEFMVCERCDAVKSVAPEALEPVRAEIRAKHGYEARFSHFPIVGLCPRCAADEGVLSGDSDSRRDSGEGRDGHRHDQSHSHQGGIVHDHAQTANEHEHTEHEHEHSHGDRVHSHPHAHQRGVEVEHSHQH